MCVLIYADLPVAGHIELNSLPACLPANFTTNLSAVLPTNLSFLTTNSLGYFKADSVKLNYTYPPGEPQSALFYLNYAVMVVPVLYLQEIWRSTICAVSHFPIFTHYKK